MSNTNETGTRYGRLVVQERASTDAYGKSRWLCLCDCGNTKIITGNSLRTKHTLSCGCLWRDRIRQAITKHGDAASTKPAPEYLAWKNMIKRCQRSSHPEFHNYGARGIGVCPQWLNSYPTFLLDMGRRPSSAHSIDRIDNNGNYEPHNCRWATRSQQQRNKRKPQRHNIKEKAA